MTGSSQCLFPAADVEYCWVVTNSQIFKYILSISIKWFDSIFKMKKKSSRLIYLTFIR